MRHAPYSSFDDATVLAGPNKPKSRLAVLWAKVLWVAGLPGRVAAIRRDMALLGRMTGAELSDIGLTRQDLWDAAALPIGQAPDQLFTRRAAERRRAERNRRH